MRTITNLFLLGLSLLVAFAIGEVASRYIAPISLGPSIVDLSGNKQQISYVQPNNMFRIVTPDYDAVTSITRDGYRAPAAKGNPDTVFIGDSFTYAQGVTDKQAFPAMYCQAKNLNCANLSVPGASTLYEVDRLEYFLAEKNWRPQKVHFFFFTGNDFVNNIEADAKRSRGERYEPSELNLNPRQAENRGSIEKFIDLGLKYSNLLRIAYYQLLPMIRNSSEENTQKLDQGLAITKKEFSRLEKLSNTYGFEYQLYALFPEPEIKQDIYKTLGPKLQALTNKQITMLGDVFKPNTSEYFFPSDGHLSVEGNTRLAEFLLKQ